MGENGSSILFLDEGSEELFRVVERFSPNGSLDEVYLKGKGEYVHRLQNFAKSMAGKFAWDKYKYKFMPGIKRAARDKRTHKLIGSLAQELKKKVKILRHGGISKDKANRFYTFECRDYDRHKVAQLINAVKSRLMWECRGYGLEEQRIPVVVQLEYLSMALSKLEACVLFEKVPMSESVLELNLLLICQEQELQERGMAEKTFLEDPRTMTELYIGSGESELRVQEVGAVDAE